MAGVESGAHVRCFDDGPPFRHATVETGLAWPGLSLAWPGLDGHPTSKPAPLNCRLAPVTSAAAATAAAAFATFPFFATAWVPPSPTKNRARRQAPSLGRSSLPNQAAVGRKAAEGTSRMDLRRAQPL